MISTESFSREWISQRSTELDYKDKPLLEKVIRAFSLLEMLVQPLQEFLRTDLRNGED